MNDMDAKIWQDMFALSIPWLEKIIRPIIVYVALLVGLRLAGKRELAQLNPFDLVVLLTISNTVQNAIIGEDNSVTGGIIGAATLLMVNYFAVRLVYRNNKIERIVEGTEDVLIDQGKVNQNLLARDLISLEELEIAAHRQGFASLEEIERAVLEPEGGITFIAHKPQPEASRQEELLNRLDGISEQIRHLEAELASLKGQQ
jgi:uncharacterized membrane protein YcaP (DUF421 family)